MNPKHLNIRMDRATGDYWLTEEKYKQPPRRVRNMTSAVIAALCSDLLVEDGTEVVTRDVRFADGWEARITVEVKK